MTSRPLQILIVDDHAIMRHGIAAIIGPEVDMKVIGEAKDGAEAVRAFAQLRPDITLMDLQMPVMSGIEAIAQIRAQSPKARIVVLTTYEGDVQAVRALRAGASGYLLKSSLINELLQAIRTVYAGHRFVHAQLAQEIALHCAEESLSTREVAILEQVATGRANKEVAWELSVSEETIKAHLKNIFLKLGASDRTQAVTMAVRRGIISL